MSSDSSLTPPPSPFQPEPSRPPDDVVDGWALLRRIGVGGMSAVFEVRHAITGKRGALKWLHASVANNEVLARRFTAEIDALVELDHPNIVSVVMRGRLLDREYVVLELVDGGTLRDDLERNGPVLPAEAIRITLRVLDALETAHRAGIIHRDVKPSNILLDGSGAPRLADFGIAHDVNADRLTSTGNAVGTTSFMAPEQAMDASRVGPTADVYAVGATLYAMVTGGRPLALFQDSLDSPRMRRLPRPLRGIVYRATRFDASRRFQSAAEMQAALLELSEPPSTAPSLLWGGAAIAALGGVVGSFAIASLGLVGLAFLGPESLPTAPSVAPTIRPKLVIIGEEGTALPVRSVQRTDTLPEPVALAVSPAPAGPPGQLYVNSRPPSELSVDGVPVGRTGWSGPVDSGTRRLRLVLPDGRVHHARVHVPADTTVRFCWDFRKDASCRRR